MIQQLAGQPGAIAKDTLKIKLNRYDERGKKLYKSQIYCHKTIIYYSTYSPSSSSSSFFQHPPNEKEWICNKIEIYIMLRGDNY